MKSSQADWILLDCLHFINNLYLSLKIDDPLELSMRRIFSEVIGKLKRYAKCSDGLHLLTNTIYGPGGKSISVLESHHLYIDADAQMFLTCALDERQPAKKLFTCDKGLPFYIRSEEKGMFSGTGMQKLLRDFLGKELPYNPLPCDYDGHWKGIFEALNMERAKRNASPIVCESKKLLLIPLAPSDDKLPGGNLGTILLWDNADNGDACWEARVERLILAAKTIGAFVSRLLETHYGVTAATFLPSYQIAGPKSVGIMFADIRDFTPTMEIARNFNLVEELRKFMRSYCKEMNEIIRAKGGRVSSFSGDGIMALFGEYNLTPAQTVLTTIDAAKMMCLKFDELKKEFLATKPIKKFFAEAVEPLDFRLGIGINFGEVIFDYFGADGSRVYSALGDHVNFAQRLESQACKPDERLQSKIRAPILVSRPAWLAAGFNVASPEALVTIQVKGKPYAYQAYQVTPE